MKRFLILLSVLLFPCLTVAASMPDNMYFRAMNDEMNRSLKQLRLKGQPNPYLISYWIFHEYEAEITADMGALITRKDNLKEDGSVAIQAFVSVGSDKQDGLGFIADEQARFFYSQPKMPSSRGVPIGYDSLRQTLWQLTDEAYLQAVDLYKKKQNYKKKKNIQDTLPDVIAVQPAHYVEPITPFELSDMNRVVEDVESISALGKGYPYLESFEISLTLSQNNWYSLNSRGSFAQYSLPRKRISFSAVFRRPDGQIVEPYRVVYLRDTSVNELARVKQEAQKFLEEISRNRNAKPGEAYVGPVLLKPRAASFFLRVTLLNDLQNSKPFLLSFADDDDEAGKLYKKRQLRASTDLITVYDKPLERQFDGFALENFFPVDGEGVKAENLTLVKDGYVKEFPLTQRPLAKKHRSNGHARIRNMYGPRENLTTVFVEPTQTLTDLDMENKLRDRLREMGLPYGYILDKASSEDIGMERIYTEDGRKEPVIDLRWDDYPNARDLRSVLAVGGQKELLQGFIEGPSLVTPSILLREAELVPVEHKPHRPPFVARPE